MKFKFSLIFVPVTLLLMVLAIATFYINNASAQEADNEPIRIEVSRNGFNNTPGEFRLEVEEGQEVVITFVYGDGDLPQNNPHVIFISGYKIQTEALNRENPEVTVRFTAGIPAEVNFTCIIYCIGHDNIQGGRIIILPSAKPPTEGEVGSLLLTAPKHAQSGQPLTLTAFLRDNQGKPIGNTMVKLLIKADFFTSGLMEIGEALTNDQGVALFEYTPRLTGNIQIIVRHEGGSHETAVTVSLAEADEPFYQPETGIQLPAPGEEVLIGPKSAVELEEGKAPMTAFRLPGGILSWLLLLVGAVMLVWGTYFRVMYQVFRIPIGREIVDTDTRSVPLVGMIIAIVVGIILILILITGPYSHIHLLR